MEAHYEIHSTKKGKEPIKFSPQQVVSCTPNPHMCGGTGGCGGATVELGMDFILKNGLASDAEVPYKAEDLKCQMGHQDGSGTGKESDFVKDVMSPAGQGGLALGMNNYNTLPSNKERPLMVALVKYGPVGVAVAADSWFEYSGGVFDGCPKDGVINHAVTAYGYGTDNGAKYWNIRNSYGSKWGEHGFIRLKRTGDKHCGMDRNVEEGVACKGVKDPVKICGMCGVLYDSVVPFFVGEPGKHAKGSPEPEQSGLKHQNASLAELHDTPVAIEMDKSGLMRIEAKRHGI